MPGLASGAARDLHALQGSIKRDPEGYADEFELQVRRRLRARSWLVLKPLANTCWMPFRHFLPPPPGPNPLPSFPCILGCLRPAARYDGDAAFPRSIGTTRRALTSSTCTRARTHASLLTLSAS